MLKIEENDKTVFNENGFPLSPKEITADSPNVREGFLRLRHACQINLIKIDHIENFLFGSDYRFEGKLSIKVIKQAAETKLMMKDEGALDFARYLIEQNSTISHTIEPDTKDFVVVDQTRSAQAFKVMTSIYAHMQQAGISYFNADKEDKMKLIIGEKLQEPQLKTRLISVLKANQKSSMT